MNKRIAQINPFSMTVFGLCIGTVARLTDIYAPNFGDIFSQMSIWILFGTCITLYSKNRKSARVNVLLFCLGMLLTYYVTAALTDGIYGWPFIIGWTAFALISPLLAYVVWMSKDHTILSRMISIGIIVISILSTMILFDHLRIHDFVINGILFWILFLQKKKN